MNQPGAADIVGSIDPKATDRERYDTIDRRVKARVAACEQDGSRCTVASFDKANIPYRPKRWLKVAVGGVKPDDLVFVVGYPGRTQRHQTDAEGKGTVEWALPRSIRLSEEQLALIDTLTKENPALAKKQAREQELAAWIAASPARQLKYGEALTALQKIQAQGESMRERNAAPGLLPSSSSYLASAQTLYRLSLQRPKDDAARDAGFQERDWSRFREGQDRLQRTIDPAADRALLRWALEKAVALPAGQRIEPLDRLVGLTPGMDKPTAGAAVEKYLDTLYKGQ